MSRDFYRWRPHPWHGLEVGAEPPGRVNAYVEITPFDRVKYELDKKTGFLRVDRPQRTSSAPPTLYGFIPRTYSGKRVGALTPQADGGDRDPLDICVLSEQAITRSEVILSVRVIGGLQMVDSGEADDKIVAVLESDYVWGHVTDISELPEILTERLRHYFLTYKIVPGKETSTHIDATYGSAQACRVVAASIEDYREYFEL